MCVFVRSCVGVCACAACVCVACVCTVVCLHMYYACVRMYVQVCGYIQAWVMCE